MAPPRTNVIYEVSRNWSGWSLFWGQKHIKNKPHPSQFGIPIGVRLEKHRASTRKTTKSPQFCSPESGGTPKTDVIRGQKDLYILLDRSCPAPYIDRPCFVRRSVSQIQTYRGNTCLDLLFHVCFCLMLGELANGAASIASKRAVSICPLIVSQGGQDLYGAVASPVAHKSVIPNP